MIFATYCSQSGFGFDCRAVVKFGKAEGVFLAK